MTAEYAIGREDALGRLILAVGRRLTPSTLRGHLVLELPSGRRLDIGQRAHGPTAELRLRNWRPVWASMRRAALGFCESYIEGHWDSPDPVQVMRFYLHNRASLDRAAKPVFFRSLADRLWHVLRDNSRRGSKRNIEAHYDLGNDFYRLWLDPGMTYSSGWFGSGASDLESAQKAKYALVLDALGLAPGHRLLEIGCGWGGLAEEAAARGAVVTGITLSREQLAYAKARLNGRADLRLEDYRDTTGRFDRIASVEMIEAVGAAHWPVYFATLRDRLEPGGVAAVQAITIHERNFARYSASADFIQRYIFPGGMLPTTEILAAQAAQAGLGFEAVQVFGQDYARTLALWRQNFDAAWPAIANLGFNERFRRKWRLYLDYCEAGFRHGVIDVGVYRFTKPA
jgi:cyclopropane-fatty-acyl-phospholipid synthase